MKTKLSAKKIDEITFAQYGKELRRLSKMISAHNSPETAVGVFIKNDHEFACGTTHPLIMPCKITADWKNYAKEQLKTNKKEIIFGKAYISGDLEKGAGMLQVVKEKGAGKIARIAKNAKGLLKKAKFGLQLATGSVPSPEDETTEEEPMVSSSSSDQTTTSETTTSTTDTTTASDPKLEAKKEKGRQTIDKMLANVEKLAKRLNIS